MNMKSVLCSVYSVVNYVRARDSEPCDI